MFRMTSVTTLGLWRSCVTLALCAIYHRARIPRHLSLHVFYHNPGPFPLPK